MKNIFATLLFTIFFTAAAFGILTACKQSYHKCQAYAKGDQQKLHDCLNF